MDSERFDGLVRALAGARSRRGFVRALAASAGIVALGRKAVAPAPVEAGGCYGYGCPCATSDTCADALVCCGNACVTSGECGGYCVADGGACPGWCNLGDQCSGCCNGFCAAYGGCTGYYYAEAGGVCSLSDPMACGPGLTCCPSHRHPHGEGRCQDSC